jgi:peptidoglycan hydrolase-like protein with peptidoglycan-binding domain
MQKILSPNKYVGRIAPIRLGIVHTMEVNESDPNVAETVAQFFATPAARASAHVCFDTNSSVRCVADEDTAWAAPGANADGLQGELAGRAAQTDADWADADSQAILERAAQQYAEWCTLHNIPVVHLSVDEILAGQRGLAGHIDITNAYHRSTHWDPGYYFPWDSFLARISQIMGQAPAAPSTPTAVPVSFVVSDLMLVLGSTGSAVKRLQVFLGLADDGIFGPITLAAVKAYQAGVGLTVDGEVGPFTWAKINAGERPAVAPVVPQTNVVSPGVPAPAFPLNAGSYFGPASGPSTSISGIYSHTGEFSPWQQRMKDRGWNISVDGIYGPQSAGVAYAFQVEKGLTPDSKVGPITWAAAWTEPVTK